MPVVVWSALRLLLLLVTTGVLWAAGMRSWLAPVVGAFLAWALSYVLLQRPRDAAARYLADRAAERAAAGGRAVLRGGAAQDADAEDAADEAARSAATPGADPRASDVGVVPDPPSAVPDPPPARG
ncbi:DUF4229 domain-containing protein [Cellulomonas sp. SLBN-39]|uniref:DUF4229 domain-containing protein n=1 Tax=Cellulomonas sp. SLBN-39 TaxID=2768446 RepID=UPI0011532B31|nr:DUF4229 domain-containing protein [Cellulomonas sp. SLBN-39]TQL03293.1 uncharacterized protein DUF4229 [Cellulomonas sp. SLBN-39]